MKVVLKVLTDAAWACVSVLTLPVHVSCCRGLVHEPRMLLQNGDGLQRRRPPCGRRSRTDLREEPEALIMLWRGLEDQQLKVQVPKTKTSSWRRWTGEPPSWTLETTDVSVALGLFLF